MDKLKEEIIIVSLALGLFVAIFLFIEPNANALVVSSSYKVLVSFIDLIVVLTAIFLLYKIVKK